VFVSLSVCLSVSVTLFCAACLYPRSSLQICELDHVVGKGVHGPRNAQCNGTRCLCKDCYVLDGNKFKRKTHKVRRWSWRTHTHTHFSLDDLMSKRKRVTHLVAYALFFGFFF
jgi:hypothetical protein